MSMIKTSIARVIVKWNLRKHTDVSISFLDAFSNTANLLIMLPEEEEDFKQSLGLVSGLEYTNKNIYLLMHDFKVSLLPFNLRSKAIEYGIIDVNWLELPKHKFIEKLKFKNINAVLDLNRKENLFYSYTAVLLNPKLRMGFVKKDSDRYYNFQVRNLGRNPEISYKNFLNCIKMF